jgi:threonine/homoserine/homoserine lactone efflux protein
MEPTLIAFVAAAALLTITPGLDTALVLRTTYAEGRRSGAAAGLGVALGCLIWGVATAAGLSMLLAASELAFTVLKWAGAVYLAWLGVTLLRRRGAADLAVEGEGGLGSPAAAFRRGLLTNLLNPKVGVFYVSFLPQFVPPGAPVGAYSLLLTVIHAGLGLAWFALLITATTPIAGFLRRPAVSLTIDRLTGGVFLVFAAKLALERRP